MSMDYQSIISLRHVGKSFRNGEIRALDDISLDVKPGEFISLVGPSGCGKTTLLRIINGLIPSDRGDISVLGAAPIPGPDMAMVFQSARLLPWHTVARNIEFVLTLKGLPREDRAERARALLGAVGLQDFAQAFPHELSGGMQQRVGLARALAVEPKLLLMDEPFAALDAITRERLRMELLQLWSRRAMAVVFVTHDIDEALLLSQRIVLLRPRPGRIDQIVDVVFPEPRWQTDPRSLPGFLALRRHLWSRINEMIGEGDAREDLAGAFPRA